MNKRMKMKLNNDGSSILLAMIAIIFVTLLASTVLAIASSNLSFKRLEGSSKKAFYTAETAVDQLYDGLGDMAMKSINAAYVDQLSKVVAADGALVDNATANLNMKKGFVNAVLKTVTTDPEGGVPSTANADTGSYVSGANPEATVKWLRTLIDDTTLMNVKSVGLVKGTSGALGYYVDITDVIINYQSDKGIYSDITTDFRISYPNIGDIVFNNSKHDSFLDYCLIADRNVAFGSIQSDSYAGTKVLADVNAGIYAGNELNINNGSEVTIAGDAKVVAHSAIQVISSDEPSKLTLAVSKVWTKGDILLKGATTSSTYAQLVTLNGSKVYVGDDLEMNVEGSVADVGGAYYGYGYSDRKDSKNSSMIMNKKYCLLNVHPTALQLLGHAYIDVGFSGGYETGESAAAKNNQEIYMVLDTYLKDVTNPFSSTDSHAPSEDTYDSLTRDQLGNLVDFDKMQNNFFAWDLLDADKPVKLEFNEAKNAFYIYYNFAGTDTAADTRANELYAMAVAGGVLNGTDVTANNSWKEEYKILMKDTRKTFKTGGGIYMPSLGAGIEVLGPYPVTMAAGTWTMSDGNLDTASASSKSSTIISALSNDYDWMASLEAFDRIINVTEAQKLGSTGYSGNYDYTELDGSVHNYKLRIINTKDYTLTASEDYGIIVHTGDGTLTVPHTFTGLLLSNGTIDVKQGTSAGTVQIIESDRDTLTTILDSNPEFAKYFSAYYTPPADENSSIGQLNYDDFISLRNWRKFEDN